MKRAASLKADDLFVWFNAFSVIPSFLANVLIGFFKVYILALDQDGSHLSLSVAVSS